MSMLRLIKAGWQSRTPVEKVKLILRLVCGIGMGAVCGDIASEHMSGHNGMEKAAIVIGAWGLGGYLGEKSGEYIGETIDAAVELNEIRKKEKERQQKEENANG